MIPTDKKVSETRIGQDKLPAINQVVFIILLFENYQAICLLLKTDFSGTVETTSMLYIFL